MAEKRRDPEIEALQAVHAALKPLSPDERTRVLASVYALLGMQGPEVSTQPSVLAPAAATPSPSGSAPTLSARPPAPPLSINELVREKSPGTNAQWIALFAYYRDRHEGIPRFSRDDLKGYFSKAKEQPPTNWDRDFVEAVKKGWIHEDGGDSYVTSKGIEAVESGFPGERKYAKRPGPPRRPRRTAARSKSRSAAKLTGKRKSRGAPRPRGGTSDDR